MVWTYAGRSKRDVKVEKSSKFAKNWPVQRAMQKGNLCSPELDTYSTYFTCTLLPILYESTSKPAYFSPIDLSKAGRI